MRQVALMFRKALRVCVTQTVIFKINYGKKREKRSRKMKDEKSA